jgi:hypothetical protein
MRIFAPAALLFLTASCATAPETGTAWRPLFDGKTLAGWTPKVTGYAFGEDPHRFFRAENGAIRVSYDNYPRFTGAFGHLHYKTPFSAYRVRFEYRFSGSAVPGAADWQHSNSGIMLHGQPPETIGRNQEFPVSLEMQLLGAERPKPEPSGNLCTPGTNVVMNGKLETEHCILSTSPVLPNHRWIRAEAEVTRDGHVTHFIKGQPVLRYSAPQYDPTDADAKPLIAAAGGRLAVTGGYLSLQAEGHPVEFRNIEIRELD